MRYMLAMVLSSTLVLQAAPLMAGTGPGGAQTVHGQASAVQGIITGTLQGAVGQTLANYKVQVRDLQTGRIAGTATSNAGGSFSFAGLPSSSYVVEAVGRGGEIVSCNPVRPAGPSGSAVVNLSVAALPSTTTAPSSSVVTTAAAVARAAALAGINGAASPAGRDHASPSR